MFFLRTESFQQFIRYYPIVTIIVAIHIVLFLITEVMPGVASESIKYDLLGINYLISDAGEYWRLVTPIFVHLSLTHILFNSFSLILFGPALEVMLGKVKFILAYLTMGVLANVATLFLQPPIYSHAGASGAIFGLFGIYLYLLFMRPNLLDGDSRQIVIVIVAIALIMTFATSGINVTAHVFGLLAGLALGPILFANHSKGRI